VVCSTLKNAAHLLCGVVFFVAASPAIAASSASSGAPCWKLVLNDWYDGTISSVYPLPCYREAIDHIPATMQIYSSARDDILNAEAKAAHRLTSSPKHPAPEVVSRRISAPGSEGHGSIPVPLLVLAALAILLVVAGAAGTIWRRLHGRKPGAP
jgi:hypothetical protein